MSGWVHRDGVLTFSFPESSNPNRSLEFELISMFLASRFIQHFPEGIAGYVEGKCV